MQTRWVRWWLGRRPRDQRRCWSCRRDMARGESAIWQCSFSSYCLPLVCHEVAGLWRRSQCLFLSSACSVKLVFGFNSGKHSWKTGTCRSLFVHVLRITQTLFWSGIDIISISCLYCIAINVPRGLVQALLDNLLFNMQALGTNISVWREQWWSERVMWNRGWCGMRPDSQHRLRDALAFCAWMIWDCPRYLSTVEETLSCPHLLQTRTPEVDVPVLRAYF